MEILPLASDFFTAAAIRGLRKAEKEWQLEASPLPAGLNQAFLALIFLGQVSRYYKLQDLKTLSTPTYVIGGVIPLAMGYAVEGSKIDRVWTEHLGEILVFSYCITTLAILKTKKYACVGASLSGYIVKALVDRDHTPEKIRGTMGDIQVAYDRFSTLLFDESPIFRGMAFARCITYGENRYADHLYGRCEPQGIDPGHLGNRFAYTKRPTDQFKQTLDRLQGEEGVAVFNTRLKQKMAHLEGKKGTPDSYRYPEIALCDSSVAWEMLALVEKIYEKILEDKQTPEAKEALEWLKKGPHLSGAALTETLPRLYCKLYADTLTQEEKLFALLYDKQDEFLDRLFEADYRTSPHWFVRFSGGGTSQKRNIYRLFYGEDLGLNVDFGLADATQDPMGMPFSRLIWFRYVASARREFFETYYTRPNVIDWVKTGLKIDSEDATRLLQESGVII